MDKETRKEFILIRYSDLTAICEHFEKMESEGWRLVSLDMMAEYRRCEPKKVRYSAELLESGRILGNKIPEKSREYIDMCEQAGWSLVWIHGLLHIFRSEKYEAPEIVSDPEEKLQNIKKATFRGFIGHVAIVFLLPLQILVMAYLFPSPAIIATMPLFVSMMTFSLFILGFLLLHDIEFLCWYQKAKRAVRAGELIPFKDTRAVKRATTRERIFVIAVLIIPILFTLPGAIRGEFEPLRMALISSGFTAFIFLLLYFFEKPSRSSSKTTVIATAVALSLFLVFVGVNVYAKIKERSADPSVGIKTDTKGAFIPSRNRIPVSISDIFPDIETGSNEVSGESTVLAGLYEYESYASDPESEHYDLSYSLYFSPFDGLLHSYAHAPDITREDDEITREEVEAATWGAEKAYSFAYRFRGDTDYIIVYDRYVLVLRGLRDTEPADIEKMAAVFGGLFEN
jgi:hypothetical protein